MRKMQALCMGICQSGYMDLSHASRGKGYGTKQKTPCAPAQHGGLAQYLS